MKKSPPNLVLRLAWAANMLMLLATPLLLAVQARQASTGSWAAVYALAFSLLGTFVFLLPAGSWRGFFLWNLPMLVLAPIFAWYVLRFGEPPNAESMTVLLTSSRDDITGMLDLLQLWHPLLLLAVLLLLYLSSALAMRHWPLPQRLRRVYTLGSVPALLLLLAMPAREDGHLYVDTGATLQLYMLSTYPFGGMTSLVGGTLGSLNDMGLFRKKTAYGARLAAPDTVPETHILVIGESARANEFHLYGYPRQTSPELEGIPGLISFQQAYAAANLTVSAVPMMMTGMAPDHYQTSLIHGSLVDAASEAGYFTAWLSNQEISLVGIFKPRPDVWKLPSDPNHSTMNRTVPDEVLLPCLQDILRRPAPRKFIVIHTYGSHWSYPNRLPENGFHFSGTSRDGAIAALESDSSGKATQAVYDDTILYTDHVLAGIIHQAQQLPGRVTVTYLSDHGENLMAREGAHGHGFPDFYMAEMRIPLLFWANPRFMADRAPQWAALQQHRDTPFQGSGIFHTEASIMGLQFPEMDVHRDLSSGHYLAPDVAGMSAIISASGTPRYLHEAHDWSPQAIRNF